MFVRLRIGGLAVLTAVITVIPSSAWSKISDGESAEEAALTIGEAVMATGVENLKPVGPGAAFPSTAGRLYCFTRIKGAVQNTTIKHLWFKGDTLVMEITLPIQSADWRTYSTKTITPASVGSWRVDITTESGTVLRSVAFTIE